MVMSGTRYRLKLPKQTDDEARQVYERWLRQTGRDRVIDWATFKVEQADGATFVEARAR